MAKKSFFDNLLGIFQRHQVFFISLLTAVTLYAVSARFLGSLRVDLTQRGVFSLSDVSKDAVKNLAEPMRIRIFFSKDLPAPHDETERYLRDLMLEYDIAANSRFSYTFYDCTPTKEETSSKIKENIKTARDYGINPVQIRTFEKDQVKFVNAYMGVVFQHGDLIEKIPSLESTSGLEYRITGIMRNMKNKISELLNLSGKVQVKLFLSSSLYVLAPKLNIEGLEDVPDKLTSVLKTCNDKNYNKLEYVLRDSTTDTDVNAELDQYNLRSYELAWPALKDQDGRTIPAGKGIAALVIEHMGKQHTIPLIDIINLGPFGTRYQLKDVSGMEDRFNSIIDSLLDINDEIQYLSDHGAIPIHSIPDNPYMQQFQQQQGGSEGEHFNK
jgi:hypothetical protein